MDHQTAPDSSNNDNSILVLGLGNELLHDDGVGLFAVRELQNRPGIDVDIKESACSGLALLETFLDYKKAIVIDAIETGRFPAGTVIEINPEELSHVHSPSPHYSGLPEMSALAQKLGADFPKEIKIFAVEVEDLHLIQEGLSPPVAKALPVLIQKVEHQLKAWSLVQ